MLRSLLIFILCGTLVACASDRADYARFEVKMDTGEDAYLKCVKDPAEVKAAGPGLRRDWSNVADFPLMADGKSYLVPPQYRFESIPTIYSPVDAEPCKSLIAARDADNTAGEAGEAGDAAAAFTAGILLGIIICVPTLGALCY